MFCERGDLVSELIRFKEEDNWFEKLGDYFNLVDGLNLKL